MYFIFVSAAKFLKMGKKSRAKQASLKDDVVSSPLLVVPKKISPLKRNELSNISDKLLKRNMMFIFKLTCYSFFSISLQRLQHQQRMGHIL